MIITRSRWSKLLIMLDNESRGIQTIGIVISMGMVVVHCVQMPISGRGKTGHVYLGQTMSLSAVEEVRVG